MKGGTFWRGITKCVVALVIFLVLFAHAVLPVARAQQVVARVASVQRVVEKRGAATPFRKAGAGTSLGVGDALRTGKRAKADMKFADGSLLRLGQITSIEIQSTKDVRLSGGRLLYAALKPGRVVAGSGTAEIIGSVAVIALDSDNSGEFTLYSGSMNVSGDRTVTLLPGQSVRVDPQGRLSKVRRATPFSFLGGELNPDLLTTPEPGPFTGSVANEHIREGADRTAVDQLLPLGNPVATSDNGVPRGQPFPTPFPTPLPGASSSLNSRLMREQRGFAPTAPPEARPRSSENRSSWSRSPSARSPRIAPLLSLVQAPDASASNGDAAAATAIADAPASTSTSAQNNVQSVGAENLLAGFDIDTQPALDHIDDIDRNLGRFFDADARAVGAASDSGSSVYGARFRGFGAVGKAYFEGTLAPLQLRRDGQRRDSSSLATGYVLLRDTRGEVRIGRQRFMAGPTQAAFFGSLVRQGGRETMDAIRIAPRVRRGVQLEAAYICDAFPRNLPFQGAQVSGAQRAFYGRAALRKKSFSLGVNALRYTSGLSSSADGTLGATVDFALPLVRDELEFYGELGRDPFRRDLRTFGLGFPGLYERTNFDAFLEYAHLSERAGVSAPPSEVTLRVYRRIGRVVNTITSLSRFGGGEGWKLAVGVAVGGSRNTRYGNLP